MKAVICPECKNINYSARFYAQEKIKCTYCSYKFKISENDIKTTNEAEKIKKNRIK